MQSGERVDHPGHPVVLFVGRLAVEKNVEVLIRAIAHLARTRPDLVGRYERLYARGANLPKDERTRLTATVRRLAAELGIGAGADGQLAGRGAVRGVPGDRDASFPAGSLPEPGGAPAADRDAAPTLF